MTTSSGAYTVAEFVRIPMRWPRCESEFSRIRLRSAWLLTIALALSGCNKPPQIPPDSRQLIGSLRTAVSAKRKDWLETNAKLVEEKHSQNKLTDEQYQELEVIITLAREDK
jgi:hypothetical protein